MKDYLLINKEGEYRLKEIIVYQKQDNDVLDFIDIKDDDKSSSDFFKFSFKEKDYFLKKIKTDKSFCHLCFFSDMPFSCYNICSKHHHYEEIEFYEYLFGDDENEE